MKSSSATALLLGTSLTAAGYGATFLFSVYYLRHGGTESDSGDILASALYGTLVGVPFVGWFSGCIGAARLIMAAALAMACGYALFVLMPDTSWISSFGAGFLIGLGWGVFYIGAPMALSERVSDNERGLWFIRFSAFQMAGICGAPALLGTVVDHTGMDIGFAFVCVVVTSLTAGFLFHLFSEGEPRFPDAAVSRRWFRVIGQLASTESIRPIIMVGLGGCVFSGMMAFQHAFAAGGPSSPQVFFTVHAATAIAARVLLAKRLVRAPQAAAITVLLGVMTVGVVTLLGAKFSASLHLVSAATTGLGYGLAYPLIQAWTMNAALPTLRHGAQCWFVISYFVGIFGFPPLGGWVLRHLGSTGLICTLSLLGGLECALACASIRTANGRTKVLRDR